MSTLADDLREHLASVGSRSVALLNPTEEAISLVANPTVVNSPDDIHPGSVEHVVVCSDPDPRNIFETLVERGFSPSQIYIPVDAWIGRLCYHRGDPVARIMGKIPAYLGGGVNTYAPYHLWDAVNHIAKNNVPGAVVNLGVAYGWSMYLLALMLRELGDEREIIGFDTFSGFTTTTELDVFSEMHPEAAAAYRALDYENVKRSLEEFPNITLVKGDIRDTVHELNDKQVALAFFDMDDYTPTKISLHPIYSRMPIGGIIVHDHYAYHTLGNGACYGQRRAMDEFLQHFPMFNVNGSNVFVKTHHYESSITVPEITSHASPQEIREAFLRSDVVLIRQAININRLDWVRQIADTYYKEQDDKYLNLPRSEMPRSFLDGQLTDAEFRAANGDTFSLFSLIAEPHMLNAVSAIVQAPFECKFMQGRRVSVSGQAWSAVTPFHLDAQYFSNSRYSLTLWIPFDRCGKTAPGMQLLLSSRSEMIKYAAYDPNAPDETDELGRSVRLANEKLESSALAEAFPENRFWAPQMEPGDVLIFSNWALHRTFLTQEMSENRFSVELRLLVDRFEPD